MSLRWTKQAQRELLEAYLFVAEDSVLAAERQLAMIKAAVENLSTFPEMGRIGRISGTRELVIQGTPYVVAYQLSARSIWVLAVLHGARRWPERFS